MTRAHAYGSYGETVASLHVARVAFAGEVTERETGWYLLGNRLYSPVLRRFLAPDPESPFSNGGFNRYIYCSGDPVNRIDPTGNAWTDWLASGLMLGLTVVGSVLSAGALTAPLAAATSAGMTAAAAGAGVAGSVAAAVATPGVVAASIAATMDVYSTVAAVGSIASMATHNQQASTIFGWISMGTGIASGASAVTAAKQISSTSTKAFATRGAASATSGTRRASNTATAQTTVSAVRATAPVLASSASSRTDTRGSTRGLVTRDATTSLPQMKQALAGLKADGANQTTLLFGTRGSREAFRNPHGKRRQPREGLFRADTQRVAQAGASAGVKVDAIDMNLATKEQLRRRLSEDGIHVAVSGHGLVDPVTLTSLNMPDTVSDYLLPVRASP
jgi:RHS repeat-associated protein